MLALYPYITNPDRTGQIPEDARALLCANGKAHTQRHADAVAAACRALGARYSLCADTCYLCGMLHDIGAVVRPDDMLAAIQARGEPLCEAERRYPFLLHQRVSAIIAREDFCLNNPAIITAISVHTTLRAHATMLDMALFLADKLAWDQPGVPPYQARVAQALDTSLPRACLVYMEDTMDSGRMLCPHTDWTAAMAWLRSLS